jgi:hypothetical protein
MNKPDYEIEKFWYGLKNSMINFYRNKNIKRPINNWSNKLNILQSKEQYEEIEENIRNYISLYGIDVMRHMEIYHLNILKTNIKRWNVISPQFGFVKLNSKKYYNIIFLLIDIYEKLYDKLITKDLIVFASEIEILLINEDFNYLIDLSVRYKLISIIDKLGYYIDIIDIINKKYNLNITGNVSGKKILKLIPKEQLI